MTEKTTLVVEGFRIQLLHVYIKYSKGFVDRAIMAALGPIRNEELLCDYHQLLVKSLSPSEREKSSRQL